MRAAIRSSRWIGSSSFSEPTTSRKCSRRSTSGRRVSRTPVVDDEPNACSLRRGPRAPSCSLRSLCEQEGARGPRLSEHALGSSSTTGVLDTLRPDVERRLHFLLVVGSENEEDPIHLDERIAARIVSLVHEVGGEVDRVDESWFVMRLKAVGRVSEMAAWAAHQALKLRPLISDTVP